MAGARTYSYTSRFGETYTVDIHAKRYRNDSLAVTMDYENTDEGCWFPYTTVTVNIEPESNMFVGTTKAFVDTNNLGDGIVGWLEENGIAKPTGETAQSGFCTYPVVEFDREALGV